ncbi:hypothetical protein EOD42_05705 [Rhodovarius crocodyli]|uniref:Uncharacterized protein n=1 Tax=Rhodovarius crocodyli TaxID=1979269 RepID=A0A437MPM8_9PROT|nr:hypothetical protein [Rhodovarius crocodyli]RVT99575.1 hypothetical protein EOD42_05705 [Rhodovarius crocodyli]
MLMAAGCVPEAETHASHFTLGSSVVQQRQLQSRRYDTADERMLLQAVAGVFQDLGFQIDESRPQIGLIMGSKERSAVEAGQVAAATLLILLAAAAGAPQQRVVIDRDQRIRILVVVRRVPQQEAVVARVTMQRVVVNTENRLSRIETLDDPRLYQEFFNMLSQSVFLTGHEI